MLLALCHARASDDFPIGKPHLFYLENGLEVLLVENHSSPMIAATAIVRVGSSDETPDLNGATHFLEHLLFDGTETRTQQDIEDAFERLGGYNNAQTSNDHTAFMILAEKEKFGQALELQADMLFFSTLAPEQIAKEKGIVTEEIGQNISNDPKYLAALTFDRLRWEETAYAYPVLGTRESIEAMERDKLWTFYKRHYVPDNMSLLIMGDFEPHEMMRLVETSYGKARPGAMASRHRERPRLAPSWEPLRLTSTAGSYLWLAFPWEPIRGGWALEPVEMLLPSVLDAVVGEPLREQLKGDILSLSWSWDITRGGVQLLLQMDISPTASPEALLNPLRARLMSLDPTSASLSLWRAKANAWIDDEIDQSQRFHFFGMLHAGRIGRDGCRGLLGEMREMSEFRDKLEAARIGSPGIMKTVSEAIPLVMLFRPAEKTVATTERLRQEMDTTSANGLRLLIRSESSMPIFAAHFLFQGRSSTEGPEHMGWVDILHRLLKYGIPSVMGKAELGQKLDSLRLRWKLVDDPSIPFDDYYTQPDFSFIRLGGPTASQEEGLRLVFELLKSNVIAQEDLAAVQKEMLNLIQMAERSPRNQADMAFRQTLLGAHPLSSRVLGTVSTISAADLPALKELRQAYFRPNRLILSIVTSETVEGTMAMVESLLGTWESGSSPPELPPPSKPLDSLVRLKVGARQAQIRFGAVLPNLSKTQRQEMEIWTALLSDHLQNDLREKRGLAYSVGADLAWQREWGWMTLRIGTQAENIPVSLEAMKQWVRRLQTEPLDQSRLEKVYASWRGTQLMRRMARDQQAFQLGWAAMKGEEPFASLPEIGLDSRGIAQTARDLLAGSQWIQIIVE